MHARPDRTCKIIHVRDYTVHTGTTRTSTLLVQVVRAIFLPSIVNIAVVKELIWN